MYRCLLFALKELCSLLRGMLLDHEHTGELALFSQIEVDIELLTIGQIQVLWSWQNWTTWFGSRNNHITRLQ